MRVETIADAAVSRIVSGRLSLDTRGEGTTDVTPLVADWVGAIGAGRGLVSAFVQHTTASLVIQENADPAVRADLLDALDRLAPKNVAYRHGEERVDDMPGHVKATPCGASVSIPCDGRLLLGTWQALYLVEHRAAGRPRTILLTYCGS